MFIPFTKRIFRRSRSLGELSPWQRLAIATHWPILAAVLVLCAVGLLTIRGYGIMQGDLSFTGKQLRFVGLGLVAMLLLQLINYQRVGRLAWAFYLFSFIPLGYTVLGSTIGGDAPLPGVNRINGAYNWIRLGGFSLQPAELMKVAFIMVLARYLRFRSSYRSIPGLLGPFALCLAPVLLILKQPDLGTALVFAPTLLAMLFVAGARMRHMLWIVGLGLVFVPIVWLAGQDHVPVLKHLPSLMSGYQRERVYAMFRDDERTLQGVGFQQHMAVTAHGSGGLLGKGLGNMPVGRNVPEGHNDMIFALIGEQFGLVGSLVVIAAFVVLIAAGIEVAGSTREPFGRLVAVGVVTMLAAQAALNIAVSMKIFPVTGVTLPFVSYGGTSLIASFIAAGLLLNIGQHRPLVMADDSFEFGD